MSTTLTRLSVLLASAALISACSVAPPMTEEETEIKSEFAASQYMPATRQMRDAIETQELFAQAAFWSREYNLNPSDLESAIKLASAVRRLGNPQRAVEITQTTRALYPRDPYLTAEFAASLIASERAADAMEPLNEALSQAAGYGRLWSLKGAALDQMERYGEARQHYARAMKITPNDPNVLANLGLSYALAGDAQTAEGWLRRAAAQPGASATVRQNLAIVLQLQGKTAEADRLLGNSPAPQRLPSLTPLNTPVTREEVLRPPTVRQAEPQRAQPAARAQPNSSFASGRALRDAQAAAQQRSAQGYARGQAPSGQLRAQPQAPAMAGAPGQPIALGRVNRAAPGGPIATSPQAVSPEAQQAVLDRISRSLQPQSQQRMSTSSMQQGQRPAPAAAPTGYAPQQQGYPQAGYAPQPQRPAPQAGAQPTNPAPRGARRRRR